MKTPRSLLPDLPTLTVRLTAALTERTGWPRRLVQQCERAYQLARWPGGAPAGFQRTLEAAKIYLQFRWLGDRPDWTTDEKHRWRLKELRRLAKRLALI